MQILLTKRKQRPRGSQAQAKIRILSVVLYVVEFGWIFERLQELIAVFDVGLDVGNLGVEDVGERALPQEDVADYPHALGVLVVTPDPAEAHHSGEDGLEFGQFFVDALVGRGRVFANRPEELPVLHDEGDDGLAVILGNVLGLVAGHSLSPRPLQNDGLRLALRFERFLLLQTIQNAVLQLHRMADCAHPVLRADTTLQLGVSYALGGVGREVSGGRRGVVQSQLAERIFLERSQAGSCGEGGAVGSRGCSLLDPAIGCLCLDGSHLASEVNIICWKPKAADQLVFNPHQTHTHSSPPTPPIPFLIFLTPHLLSPSILLITISVAHQQPVIDQKWADWHFDRSKG